jgi:hypothetical protein
MQNRSQYTQALLSSLEALFNVQIKMADRVGNNEIRISSARAKELLLDIRYCREALKRNAVQPAYFKHLDRILEEAA